jgi:hypothetical protein
LRELLKRVADPALKLIVGQQRSISELMKSSGRGRVAEDETGEDAVADDAPQFRQVDLGDLVPFAAVGIFRPGVRGVTELARRNSRWVIDPMLKFHASWANLQPGHENGSSREGGNAKRCGCENQEDLMTGGIDPRCKYRGDRCER